MDVPKYKIIFRKPSESDLHFYERCKKIKADEKLSGYLIYTPFKNIATKHSVEHISTCYYYNYMILMKGPRAKCSEFFNNGEYERHAAEFVEKIKAMDPVCISCNGVYCEDGVHYQEEAALYHNSNAMKYMRGRGFLGYNSDDEYNGNLPVMVNEAHMDSAHWVKDLPDDPDDNYYTAVCCPRIRVLFPESKLYDIDHDRWFSYMHVCYLSQRAYIKAVENRLRKDALDLIEVRNNTAKIYDQFSDSEKLMVELDME